MSIYIVAKYSGRTIRRIMTEDGKEAIRLYEFFKSQHPSQAIDEVRLSRVVGSERRLEILDGAIFHKNGRRYNMEGAYGEC